MPLFEPTPSTIPPRHYTKAKYMAGWNLGARVARRTARALLLHDRRERTPEFVAGYDDGMVAQFTSEQEAASAIQGGWLQFLNRVGGKTTTDRLIGIEGFEDGHFHLATS